MLGFLKCIPPVDDTLPIMPSEPAPNPLSLTLE